MTEFDEQPSKGITRRTIVKGAAWAVPVIAIAAPVPAFAGASQGIINFTGQNCKLPGGSTPYNNGAVYLFTVTNTTAVPITIDILTVARSGQTFTTSDVTVVKLSDCTNAGATFSVGTTSPQGELYALVTKEWSNSANGSLTLTYEVDNVLQTPETTASNDLNPFGGTCGAGGSCNAISDMHKACIMHAIGEPGC